MRYLFVALSLSLCCMAPAQAQVSVEVGLPGVNIGINLPEFPELVRVPGYPVYYAPRASANYFFYDGFYWVYSEDNWYMSSWYNGPWQLVGPEYVPLFLLRVPVRYYRRPPAYFRGWSSSYAPRWGEHWGHAWEQRRSGWDRWDRRSAPAPAPLPSYQRRYSGDRYPRAVEQQRSLQTQNYRYQPRETVTRQQVAAPPETRRETAPPPERRQAAPPRQQERHQAPPPQRPERRQAAPPPQQERHQAPPPQQPERRQAAPQQQQLERRQAAPQNRGQEKKAQQQNKGQEKKEQRDQDRH